MRNLLYAILAILLMALPLSNLLLPLLYANFAIPNVTVNISDIILAATAVALLCYARTTQDLYKTTFDSNRLNSFTGLFINKEEIEKRNIIKVDNNTNNSVLDVFIISFLCSDGWKIESLYKEIQPFIHPKQPIGQSDVLKDFRPDLNLRDKFCEFSKNEKYHLIIGLLTPLMKKSEAMIFYFENTSGLPELKFEHRHYDNKQRIYKESVKYIWKEYRKACKRKT